MRCPNCGEMNRAGARFCSKCRAALTPGVGSALLPGQTMNNGQYRVIKQLGKGGMGAIYLAANTLAFDRLAVVKEMLAYYEPGEEREALERFEQEAKTLAALKHPGIPDMYGYFSERGHNYIVMEYIEGENLAQGLTREDDQGNVIAGKPYPVEDVLRYGVEIARVLEYLANLQPEPFVHNDVKPENIIIDRNSKQAVLVDFGTAKARYKLDTGGQVGLKKPDVYGTVGYAPPEQYQGRSEPRSDVYALAATMYHLLTDDDPREHPFKFPKLADLPASLRLVLERALAPEVEKRLTAEAFRQQLESVRAGYRSSVQPIIFPEGNMATTVTGVLDLSLKHWEYARQILYDGSLASWLRNSLYNPPAADEAKGAVQAYPEDPDAGLDAFLRGLNPRLPKPQLRVIQRELDFGDIELGESKELTISLVNTAPAGARGQLSTTAPWLRPAAATFGVPPKDRKDLTIRVMNTGALVPDQQYTDSVSIEPADAAPLRVAARMRVIAPTPTKRLQPPTTRTAPASRPARPRMQMSTPARPAISRQNLLLGVLLLGALLIGAYALWGRVLIGSGDYAAGLQALAEGDWARAQQNLRDLDPRDKAAIAAVGLALDQQWVEIPAGTLMMGRDDGPRDEQPAHEVPVDAFALQRFEVTNVQYQRFVNATGHAAPRHWWDGHFAKGDALLPVVNVTWYDATAYAEWLSRDLTSPIRLPSEAEWEWAARGAAGRLYPWGNDDDKRCRNAADTSRNGPVAVGTYPCGATPAGVMDLAGNAREWTRDVWGLYRMPHSPPDVGTSMVIRGGSWESFSVVSTMREHAEATSATADLGFRCVKAED